MSYTSQATIEAALGRSLTANEIILLPLILTTVDQWINTQIGGAFGTVSETTRYFEGSGLSEQDIDCVTQISKVAVVDALEQDVYVYVAGYDYETEPLNDTYVKWLRSRFGRFPTGIKNIAVTGKFTLNMTVPNDIVYLANYLATKQLQAQGSISSGNLKQESIEGYSRTFGQWTIEDPITASILNTYIKDEVML